MRGSHNALRLFISGHRPELPKHLSCVQDTQVNQRKERIHIKHQDVEYLDNQCHTRTFYPLLEAFMLYLNYL
jgi:hypothetical protein